MIDGGEVVDMETCKELEEALEDTLADLTERVEEIEELKAALAKTTVERDALQRVVSREVIESAIANLDNRELETNPTKLRIQSSKRWWKSACSGLPFSPKRTKSSRRSLLMEAKIR